MGDARVPQTAPQDAPAHQRRSPAHAPETGTLLGLQRTAGNQAVVTLMRQPTPSATTQEPGAAEPAVVDPQETADQYEADAMAYFEDNMRAELMAAAGSEGIAIARRASTAAGNRIRSVCEPYERDLEVDTNVLNTVFAVTGGGASVAEGFSSGPRAGSPVASGAANLSSRAVRAAQGLLQVWMPTLAGYRTVGSLKEAALRESAAAADRSGEGGSASFTEYQDAALDALHEDWADEIAQTKARIVRDRIPPGMVALTMNLLSTRRSAYVTRLRTHYGAASEVGSATESAIVSSLQPRLDRLREHLEEAKERRQRAQALAAIGAGAAGGAAVGAGIGFFAGGIGAGPGALIGGAVGLVGGIGAAVGILWD